MLSPFHTARIVGAAMFGIGGFPFFLAMMAMYRPKASAGWHRALTLLEQARTWQSKITSISSTDRATSSAPITGFPR
jgi:predicted trehalose synthase